MNHRTARLAGPTGLLVAALALTGCAQDADASADPTEAPASSGPGFEYTDARDETVTLDEVPTTVVAQSSVAAALWDAGYHVAAAYGELTPGADGTLSYQAGSIDLDAVEVIGSTYGEFDTEAYALLEPDLLVDYSFDATSLWYVPAEQSEQILALAPSVAVPGTYSTTDDAIETFVDLAGRLGADTSSEEATADKEAYDAALAELAEVAASSGLTLAVMSPGVESLYVAHPAYLPELGTLVEAGLDVMEPVEADEQVFTEHSWEEASAYADVDVILVDARGYADAEADLLGVETWASLPAVQAGQVYPWYAAAPYSYKAYAEIFAELSAELAAARPL